ncbi:DUF4349 domain-containing protein [Glutamicibacter mishrai]|uniref:DUF4349 domain-containing protein n=1 Tax=Glutamicibacter mishrai TaxID=1775880 RepID=UPI0020CC11B6|nr:DUF4349 domain-containing protein [Glutamicibacter mishrai]UTT40259.1 DUF4349 domain-containing protein [Glutamicibacter mishrai]UTT40310.1 DUF4349 domain-containing protein [Glutamicibacter mishrai]
MSNTEPDIESRLKTLEDELEERLNSEAIKDSIIVEYRQALSDAQFKIAVLNGQLKLANQPTA